MSVDDSSAGTNRRTSRRLAELAKVQSPEPDTRFKKERKSARIDREKEEAKEEHKAINRQDNDPENPNEFPYIVIDNVPLSKEEPDYSILEENDRKLSVLDSGSLFYSLQKSRNTWLSGDMFEKYWIRPPRGKKASEGVELNAPGNLGGANARDKMARLFECSMVVGPHIFEVRLFTAKDESPDNDSDDEEQSSNNTGEASGASETPKQEPSETASPAPAGSTINSSAENAINGSPSDTSDQQNGLSSPQNSTPSNVQGPVFILRTPQEVQAKKLQLLNNHEATDLMMKLATQPATATDDDKKRFARYLDEANRIALPPNYIYQPSLGRPPKGPKPPKPIPKKYLQKILTVFEFKENPSGRFVIPKDSVLEVLPSGELLLSTLLVKSPEIPKYLRDAVKSRSTKTRRKKSALQLEQEAREDALIAELSALIYTPITIILRGLPRRVVLTIERSVNRYNKTIKHMEEIFERGTRSDDMSVWYHIDDNDEELQERLERPPSPPPNLVFPSKRHYKPRKKKGDGEEEEESAYKKRKRRRLEEEARKKAEEEAAAADGTGGKENAPKEGEQSTADIEAPEQTKTEENPASKHEPAALEEASKSEESKPKDDDANNN